MRRGRQEGIKRRTPGICCGGQRRRRQGIAGQVLSLVAVHFALEREPLLAGRDGGERRSDTIVVPKVEDGVGGVHPYLILLVMNEEVSRLGSIE